MDFKDYSPVSDKSQMSVMTFFKFYDITTIKNNI